jgi:hypothetical protein
MSMEDRLKSACSGRCGDLGEPPCYEICKDEPDAREWEPCAQCKEDCGLPPDPEPIDPDAAVRDMFDGPEA